MVFEAELIGLILMGHLLSESDEVMFLAAILADNQAAIQVSEYPKAKSGHLPKSKAGVVFQLCSGHIVLNKHLHQLNKSNTPSCLQCEPGLLETVHHFLFDCTHYDRERHKLRMVLGRKAHSTSYLFARKEGLKELLGYVAATGHFKRLSGEGAIEFCDTG